MPADKTKHLDHQPIKSSAGNGRTNNGDRSPLKSFQKAKPSSNNSSLQNIRRPNGDTQKFEANPAAVSVAEVSAPAETVIALQNYETTKVELNYAEAHKHKKKEKKEKKDRDLLSSDHWLTRNGHTLSYTGLYLFSILVLLRPYELFSSFSFLASTAFYFAAATLAIYIPTQLSTEGSLTILTTEVKCILALTVLAIITIPIAKDPATAWATFNDTFIKAVLMFIVMINVVRTRKRLMGLMWLSLIIGIYLSFTALDLYMKGEFKVEGYRVEVAVGGQYGNPNDMALHLVMMIPLAITLGLASRSKVSRLIFFSMAALFIAANMVTFSRGGFIGMIASSVVLAWKLGRRNRVSVSIFSLVVGGAVILLAPGNYGLRLLSIFIPALDPVGSSDQRKELLIRSIVVTLRNPWGIGIGNFPIVSIHNLVTHNSFTQVSAELGILGLAAYLIFLISPFRKLSAIERTLFANEDYGWFYYLSIGLQASIIAYMCSSFFVSVAYIWFVYYIIAYSVAFRRIYKAAEMAEESKAGGFGLQAA